MVQQVAEGHAVELRELDKKITALSDALAHLGKGSTMRDVLLIIRKPGYTTPAEFRFTLGLVDAMHGQVNLINQLGDNLLAGAQAVAHK
jgi:hypothetical protein